MIKCVRGVSIGLLALLANACEAGRHGVPTSPSAVVGQAAATSPQPDAGAVKSSLFNSDAATCSGGASDTAGPTFGFVVVNTSGRGEISVQVTVKGGSPNATYSIWINQDPGDCPTLPTATLTTNGQGHGAAHASKRRLPNATVFWVSAQEEPFVRPHSQILRSVAALLD